jgi:hypothetical protein
MATLAKISLPFPVAHSEPVERPDGLGQPSLGGQALFLSLFRLVLAGSTAVGHIQYHLRQPVEADLYPPAQ